MMTWAQLGFQDAMGMGVDGYQMCYYEVMFVGIFVLTLVGVILVMTFSNKYVNTNLLENHILESVWTILPTLTLATLGAHSVMNLYYLEQSQLQEDVFNSSIFMTIKVIGHQWFWSYEYTDLFENSLTFEDESSMSDSYMEKVDTGLGGFRLLEVDNRMIIPGGLNNRTRLLITSEDVLHSWAVPSLGVKVDACPGRLNQAEIFSVIPGVYYGQCSEICGANHSFMPIVVEIVSYKDFIN